MIETKTGIKVKFNKLDEWVIQMEVSIPHIKGDKIVASPKFTIEQLKDEIAILEKQG